jgi:hypothetical protein
MSKKNLAQQSNPGNREQREARITGPSFFEVEYLRQMKEELEIFLRSKNFSTIQQFDIAFTGGDYQGHLRIGA